MRCKDVTQLYVAQWDVKRDVTKWYCLVVCERRYIAQMDVAQCSMNPDNDILTSVFRGDMTQRFVAQWCRQRRYDPTVCCPMMSSKEIWPNGMLPNDVVKGDLTQRYVAQWCRQRRSDPTVCCPVMTSKEIWPNGMFPEWCLQRRYDPTACFQSDVFKGDMTQRYVSRVMSLKEIWPNGMFPEWCL